MLNMNPRYKVEAISDLFSISSQYKFWFDVESALIEVYCQNGVFPKNVFEQFLKHAKWNKKDIAKYEQKTKHDYLSFMLSVNDSLPQEFQKYFHFGITASDVVDSANSLRFQKVFQLFNEQHKIILKTLKYLALKYKKQIILGRTHGMPAEITSLGLLFLNYYHDLRLAMNDFEENQKNLATIMLSGQVGNFSSVPPFIEGGVAKKLNLKSTVFSTQVINRRLHANYMYSMLSVLSVIEKIVSYVRHSHRSEVAEVSEGFADGQAGSSDMPQKKNPILCENISGLIRSVKGYFLTSLENINLWQERDISHSSNERIYFEDSAHLYVFILKRANYVLLNLNINIANIRKNIDETYETIYTHHLLLNLILNKSWSREKAYEILKKYSALANESKTKLSNLLMKDKKWPYNPKETEILFDPNQFLKNINALFEIEN